MRSSPVFSVALALASLPNALAAVKEAPLDENGVPKRNILGYVPSQAVAVAAAACYAILFVALLVRWFKYRFNRMLYLIIGCLTYAAGMGIRYQVHNDPYSIGPYIGSTLLVLLSPVFFILVDYMLFSRLVLALDMERHVLIRGRWLSKGFIISDCVTFFLQCSGGGLQASVDQAKLGTTITLIGIIAQLISFVLFIIVALHWAYKVKKFEPQVWVGGQWKRLYWTLMYTTIGFLIRSIFRSIELSQGHAGYLATREVYLYCLDSLPLFLAIIAYVWIYPGQYLGNRAIYPVEQEGRLPVLMSSPEAYKMEQGRY